MAEWEYRAYDASKAIHEGQDQARNFPELALKLRQRGLQIIEAVKLNKDGTLAAQRLAKMQARVDGPEDEVPVTETRKPFASAIRTFLSWFIPPFFKRSNEQ
jgi:hypothetical protein